MPFAMCLDGLPVLHGHRSCQPTVGCQPGAVSFAIRLTVRLPDRRTINSAERSLLLTYQGRDVEIVPLTPNETIEEASWLVFAAKDFDTLAAAEEFAFDLKGLVRLLSLRSGLCFDVGRETPKTTPGKVLIDRAAAKGVQLMGTVHGVQIYETTGEDRFLSLSGEASVKSGTALTDDWQTLAHLNPARDGSPLAMACDMYALTGFDGSPRARFVSLITSLEALGAAMGAGTVAAPLRQLVDGWLSEMDSADLEDVDATERNSFGDRVRYLKDESIRRSVRHLVETYAPGEVDGDSNASFAVRCYDARSKLVHGDAVPPDVQPLYDRLSTLVERVIFAYAGA